MAEEEIDIEKEKRFFKGIGNLLSIMGLLAAASGILILAAIFFNFSQYMGKYSEVGYLDVVFNFLFSSLLVFLGRKVSRHDFYSDKYLIFAFLVIFPMPFFGFFGLLGIIFWIFFLIRSTSGFLKIGKLRKSNKYLLVFDKNIPKSYTLGDKVCSDRRYQTEPYRVEDIVAFPGKRVPFQSFYLGIIALSIFLFSVSMLYHFLWQPYQKESNLKSCLVMAEDDLESKKSSIEKETVLLQERKKAVASEVEQRRIEFKNSNPEPERRRYTGWNNGLVPIETVLTDPWYEWSKQYEDFGHPLVEINWKLDGLKKDLEIIKTEKKEQDSGCYKLYQ